MLAFCFVLPLHRRQHNHLLQRLLSRFGDDLAKIVAECRQQRHAEVLGEAKAMFDRFDENGDHKLQRKELAAALRSIGCDAKLGARKFEILLTQSIAKFDATHDGLDFNEYVQA